MGRSDMTSLPLIARGFPWLFLLADIFAEIVESLVVAVSVGHDAQLRRPCRIQRFQFEARMLSWDRVG